ncbi:unnamed protein product [Diatraea saccharalis]|uniref:Uncharacterized protein n=1 Tax=Diatraea saccharalis TaxID=40085 RepID=A0A9N9R4M5_9NEOP|nr:unnamed protein product [Diatraea saccharalis]
MAQPSTKVPSAKRNSVNRKHNFSGHFPIRCHLISTRNGCRTDAGDASDVLVFDKMRTEIFVVVTCFLVAKADYGSDGFDFRGFLPSSGYRTEDQLAEPSSRVEKGDRDRDSQPERTQRFGISTYGSTGSQGGYGGSAPGLYGPLKIDLGGVLIGSILGFGAVIILPKIIHALSYGYGGGYGRSIETDMSQLSEMLNKLDDTLNRYNIDSSACMQRLACSYVQLANENMITGNATDFDALLSSLSTLVNC